MGSEVCWSVWGGDQSGEKTHDVEAVEHFGHGHDAIYGVIDGGH